jgi:ankyrin repeat protein
MHASKNGHLPVVKFLIERGAELEQEAKDWVSGVRVRDRVRVKW